MQLHPSGNWGLHAKFHNPSTTPTSSFFSKKCHPPPGWRGKGGQNKFKFYKSNFSPFQAILDTFICFTKQKSPYLNPHFSFFSKQKSPNLNPQPLILIFLNVTRSPSVGGGQFFSSNFINPISRHFRQFWTLFIFFPNHPTSTSPLRGGIFFLGCNLILLVTDGRMQNFKTLARSLLGEFSWGRWPLQLMMTDWSDILYAWLIERLLTRVKYNYYRSDRSPSWCVSWADNLVS